MEKNTDAPGGFAPPLWRPDCDDVVLKQAFHSNTEQSQAPPPPKGGRAGARGGSSDKKLVAEM